MMVSPRQSPSSDGFTLLEMLVGLILLAIIATMMVSAFQQVRPLKRVEEQRRGNVVAGILVDVVADDIGNALELSGAKKDKQGPMEGDAKTIEFAAVVRTGFRLEGLRNVKYAIEADHAGVQHLERSTRLRVATSKDVVSEDEDLFAGIVDFRFLYLKHEKSGDLSWKEHWSDETTLPRAIRIDISAKVGNGLGRASRIVYFGSRPNDTSQPASAPEPTAEEQN